MEYITKYSSEEKIFKVFKTIEGECFIEVPSLMSMHTINLSIPYIDLKTEARELNKIGVLNYVEKEEFMNTYLSRALRLKVVIEGMDIDPDVEIGFNTTVQIIPGKELNDPDQISLFFRLSVDSPEDIPELLTELVDAMTSFLMMFNHRLVDSNICLN